MDLNNVYYRLKDPAEIKLCVLLCLRYAGEPLSDIDLKNIIITAANIDFMDYCAAFDKLIPENYIKTVWREETEKYILTKQGEETIDFFDDKITASVRAAIKSETDKYLKRDGQTQEVKCVITPVENDLYNLDIKITEGKITLLSMTLFTGSKEKTARFAKAFRNKPMDFYTDLMSSLSGLAEELEE